MFFLKRLKLVLFAKTKVRAGAGFLKSYVH